MRVANLAIDPTGKVRGLVRVFLTGAAALIWRQRALETDQVEVKKDFDSQMQRNVPAGVEVKTKAFVGLDNYNSELMATVEVSGAMGTATSKRIFLPAFFFEAGTGPLFAHDHRDNPVDLHYSYVSQDNVTIAFPSQDKVEASPQNMKLILPQDAYYTTGVKTAGAEISVERDMAVATVLYMPKDYPALKGFMDKVNASDRQTMVIDRGNPAASGQ